MINSVTTDLIREGVELTDEVLFDVLGDNHLVNFKLG